MDKRLDFRFEIQKPASGPLIELSPAEAEKILIKNVNEAGDDPRKALWQLAQFYKLNKQHEKALQRLRELIALLPDPEDKANCVFTMGQAMEQVGDYAAAIRFYKEAVALEPASMFTWYFIHNNLGFSLNTLGHFAEGEQYCHKAIQIDPLRPDAHKNLGIALEKQGQYVEAARAYVAATQANAADARAFGLLENLLKLHPELEYEFQDDLESCRKAVAAVAKKADAHKPAIHRGWRKQMILLKMNLQSMVRRLRGRFKNGGIDSQRK
jgi:tetratricopeptide (TPR) repeat protein